MCFFRFIAPLVLLFTLFSSAHAFSKKDLGQLYVSKECINCDLTLADLSGRDFSDYNLTGSDLRGADLNHSRFRRSILVNVKMNPIEVKEEGLFSEIEKEKATNLYKADFKEADLSESNLEKIQAIRTVFNEASLRNANLQGAMLKQSSFHKADFTGSLTQKADFSGSWLIDATWINGVFCLPGSLGMCIQP